jgi:hypothetical protein
MLVDDIPRNKSFSQVWISRVLRFISICDLLTDSTSYQCMALNADCCMAILGNMRQLYNYLYYSRSVVTSSRDWVPVYRENISNVFMYCIICNVVDLIQKFANQAPALNIQGVLSNQFVAQMWNMKLIYKYSRHVGYKLQGTIFFWVVP